MTTIVRAQITTNWEMVMFLQRTNKID